METDLRAFSANPMGEWVKEVKTSSESWPVDTPGGRFYAEWDTDAPVTREGQLIFFFQFLQSGKRWEEFFAWVPVGLHRQSWQRSGQGHGNGPAKRA